MSNIGRLKRNNNQWGIIMHFDNLERNIKYGFGMSAVEEIKALPCAQIDGVDEALAWRARPRAYIK